MIRCIGVGLLASLMGFMLLVQSAAIGQDKVERRKSGKLETLSGKIVEETIAGVKIKAPTDQMVPGNEITRVFYDDVPVALKQDYYNLYINEEKEKDLAKVLKDYKDFSSKANLNTMVKPNAKRYIEFRILMLEVALAETEEARADLRRRLETFVGAHGTSWEYPFAARMLARMHIDKIPPDYGSAEKVLDALSRGPNIPLEVKQESDLMLIDVMFQAGKGDAVKTRIEAALADPMANEAQKSRFRVYQIGLESQASDSKIEEVVKKLDELINKTSDNSIKALAFNVMGDCYMLKQRKRDAMWSYLWVDVVYSQDKGEHLKAMSKLLAIFDEEKDNEKVQLYRDKIARMR